MAIHDDLFSDHPDDARGHPASGVLVVVAPGELLDKITILRIKQVRLSDREKLANVGIELAILEAAQS